MTAPVIVAFRLVSPLPPPGYEGSLAILTVEDGPWIIGGIRLCIGGDGKLFLKPPKMKVTENRVILRSGPERDALIKEATTMMRGFLQTRFAASPLATAPENTETIA